MAGILNVNDIHIIDDEPRVDDRRLADVLGYDNTRSVRVIIDRHIEELKTYGQLKAKVMQNSEVCASQKVKAGGRPVKVYYLNEAQACLITMFSRTKRAALARREVITVFLAYKHDKLEHTTSDAFARTRSRAEDTLAIIKSMPNNRELALAASYMPILGKKKKRLPNFWADIEVRELFTYAHRQMPMTEVRKICEQTYGKARTPSEGAASRYWLKLDAIRGIGGEL